jgi:hypothetical protein
MTTSGIEPATFQLVAQCPQEQQRREKSFDVARKVISILVCPALSLFTIYLLNVGF